jgi:acetylornithine aminotransferase
VLDEIQTGMGRTGAWFAPPVAACRGGEQPLVPDVVTLARGSAAESRSEPWSPSVRRVAGLLSAGQHGPRSVATRSPPRAGLATLHVIERDGLLDNATATVITSPPGSRAWPSH